MEEYQFSESAWHRSCRDTWSGWKNPLFGILDAVVCVVVGAVFGWGWGLALFLFAMFCVWIRAMVSAPYKQRNEARHALEELSQTPLLVECDGYDRQEVKETHLKKKLCRWKFHVTLTNKDDKNSIRTNDISLEVHYPVTSGKVKSYTLSLIPDADKDKYKDSFWLIYRPLLKNECLAPNESIHGLYQFLDTKELKSEPNRTPKIVVNYTLLFNQILIRQVFSLDNFK